MLNGLNVTTYSSTELKGSGPTQQFLRRPVTVKAGANLTAGQVLGKETNSGKYKAYDSENEDGTEIPRGILAEDAPAASEDVHTYIYLRGNFKTVHLTGMDATALSALGAFQFEGETIL